MTAKFTNSNPNNNFNGNIRIVSESGKNAATLALKSFSIPPSTTTPITIQLDLSNRPLTIGEEYRMQVNMNGSSPLNMTEATLQAFGQSPSSGRRNKASISNQPSPTILPYDVANQADKSRRYLIKLGEIHTSASEQASGNHLGLTTGSLKIELVSNTFGVNTTLTSSLIPSGTLSSSFTYLFNPGDINNDGTEGVVGDNIQAVSALFTRIKVVNPEDTSELLEVSQGEGFTVKDFSIREISGSTLITTDKDIDSSVGNNVIFDNNLPTSASGLTTNAVLNSGTSPSYVLNEALLTIDNNGEIIFESASAQGIGTGFISASFITTASKNGVYILNGFEVDSNLPAGKNIRMRIFSGSTLMTSSKSQTSLGLGSLIAITSAETNNSAHTGSGDNVDLGFIGTNGSMSIHLDVVDNSNALAAVSQQYSASFSKLGVSLLTSSDFIKQVGNSGIGTGGTGFQINQEYNEIRFTSTGGSPFTTGAITSSLIKVTDQISENFGLMGISPNVFVTHSTEVGSFQVNTTEVPIVIERTIPLLANRQYEITQSIYHEEAASDSDRIYIRLLGPSPYTSISTDNFGSFKNGSVVIDTQTFSTIDTLEAFKGTVTTGPNDAGDYTLQIYYGNSSDTFTFDNIPTPATDVKLYLASASLKETKPHNVITRLSGDNFSNNELSNIRLKTTEGTPFTALIESNPVLGNTTSSNQTYISASYKGPNSLTETDEFTFNNSNTITLSENIFIKNGEITGSNNNTFFFFAPTSSLSITNGFNSIMNGGTFVDNTQGTFLINSASSNTFTVNQNYFSTEEQTFTINYIEPSSATDFSLSFKNTHLIFENEYMCTIDEDDFNFTLNPTARKLKSINGEELANFATGSNFKPYVTTIGLYNDEGELLVVGKLGQPTKMSEKTDTTFIVRFDT